MEAVRPFDLTRELTTASALFGDEQSQLKLLYSFGFVESNEIPIQRDMERNPEERES